MTIQTFEGLNAAKSFASEQAKKNKKPLCIIVNRTGGVMYDVTDSITENQRARVSYNEKGEVVR